MYNIVITGASRGIGLATALELARAGHQVVAAMRNPAGSPELGEQAAKEKLPIRIETMDVDSDQSVNQLFGRILAQGPVDVLVNNAGIERTGAIEETPLADFRTCMETNYFGAIRCIQAVMRPMRERGSGAIINVTSVAGKISLSPMGPYSASKFALEALSEALAQELRAFGVRVAIVEPGIIDTRMARNIEGMAGSKIYPQVRRCSALFEATIAAGAGQPQRELWRERGPVVDRQIGLLVQRTVLTVEENAEHLRSDATKRAHAERLEVAGPVGTDRGIGADHQGGARRIVDESVCHDAPSFRVSHSLSDWDVGRAFRPQWAGHLSLPQALHLAQEDPPTWSCLVFRTAHPRRRASRRDSGSGAS